MANWYYNSISEIGIEPYAQHDIGMATDQINALVKNLPVESVEAVMLSVIDRYRRSFQERDLLIRKCSYAIVHEFFDTLDVGSESIERLSYYFIEILNEYFDKLIADGRLKYVAAELRYVVVREITDEYPTLCSGYGDKNE